MPSRKAGAGAGGGRKPTTRPASRRRQPPTLAVSRDRYAIESPHAIAAERFSNQPRARRDLIWAARQHRPTHVR